jgi:hypothetical protein
MTFLTSETRNCIYDEGRFFGGKSLSENLDRSSSPELSY